MIDDLRIVASQYGSNSSVTILFTQLINKLEDQDRRIKELESKLARIENTISVKGR